MLKTIISILIAVLLFNFFGIIPNFAQSGKDAAETAKVKTSLTKIGTGEKAKIKIKLRDQREFKGYIATLNADDFIIADSKTYDRTIIAYSDVAKVKKQGGFSMFAKVAMASMAIGAGLAIVAAANQSVKCSICP